MVTAAVIGSSLALGVAPGSAGMLRRAKPMEMSIARLLGKISAINAPRWILSHHMFHELCPHRYPTLDPPDSTLVRHLDTVRMHGFRNAIVGVYASELDVEETPLHRCISAIIFAAASSATYSRGL